MNYTEIKELQEPITGLRNVFIKLTEAHRPALWKYCYKLTGNALDAEDLVQDTLLRAFAKLGYLGQALNPKAYLFRMATNCWLNQTKKKSILITNDDDTAEVPELVNEKEDITEVIEWLIVLLPPKQRIVFLLSTSFDFTNKEIAELMGTSEGTIKSYLYRARKTLAVEVKNKHDFERPTKTGITSSDQLVGKYLTAFNNLDVEGLLALLDEQATTTITGDWMEMGKEQIRNFSLHFWALDKVEKWAEYGLLDGVPVIYGFRKNAVGDKCLREVIRLEHDDHHIYSIQWNFFTKDLIQYAAEKLGVPYIVEGYQFEAESSE